MPVSTVQSAMEDQIERLNDRIAELESGEEYILRLEAERDRLRDAAQKLVEAYEVRLCDGKHLARLLETVSGNEANFNKRTEAWRALLAALSDGEKP